MNAEEIAGSIGVRLRALREEIASLQAARAALYNCDHAPAVGGRVDHRRTALAPAQTRSRSPRRDGGKHAHRAEQHTRASPLPESAGLGGHHRLTWCWRRGLSVCC
jgi:hypothetical protein